MVIENGAFDKPYMTFYWSAIVSKHSSTLYRFSNYLTLNDIVTLKSVLEVTQDHSNWYHSTAWMRFPSRFLWLYLA